LTSHRCNYLILLATLGLGLSASAQTPAPQPPAPAAPSNPASTSPASTNPDEPAPPHGTVLFEKHTDEEAPETIAPAPSQPTQVKDEKLSGAALTDDERAALTFTSYDLDARLAPATSQLDMRARVTLRNDGAKPLNRIALQISSTLTWQSVALLDAPHTRLPLQQHLLDTDADHTGKSNELLVDLPEPLLPGKTVSLDTFYAGAISTSAERLERIGATHDQALASDWDTISSATTALRGFGNVLWYPVASPQLFLGEGAQLFQAIGTSRLREENASVHLRVSIAYRGEPPAAVYFCGRRKPLTAIADDPEAPVASGSGIATAEFPAEPLGFRSPSLFVVAHPEALIAPLSTDAAGKPSEDILAVETNADAVLPRLADSAQSLAPLLETWFGPHPLSTLTVLDQEGQPFEDGPLVVAPIASLGSSSSTGALAHSLTHAWVQTGQPWIDEGLAQFVTLLYAEQQSGREAAAAELRELMRPLALSEPLPQSLTATGAGQPLIAATDELYYRRKAAAVWWMLRYLTSDESLQAALTAYRLQPVSSASAGNQAIAFERLLEKISHKDLAWFFADWVLNDRGLPDLTIADVTPRPLPAGKGHDSGWLVAVTVRNDGAAAAQVPLVIRSGTYSTSRTMRIPGLSSATERVLVEAQPTQVILNDGNTPELTSSQHTVNVTVQRQ
jgi:hypothetical protein